MSRAWLLLVVGALACSPTNFDPLDGGVEAGPICSPNLPPSSQPCLEGQCGNELGVGQQCTAGGGECNDLGFEGAFICTVDFDDTDLAFCTRPCSVDEDCGAEARCAIDPENPNAGAGCFPLVCEDEDAGP